MTVFPEATLLLVGVTEPPFAFHETTQSHCA